MSEPISYRAAGVDIDAGNDAAARYLRLMQGTFGPRVIPNPDGFAGLFNLDYNEQLFRRNYRHPILVSGTDGVGTKLRLAFLTGRHDTVGIDLVAMCANDVLVQGAEPLFFLDYLGTGRLDPAVAEQLVGGVAEGCRQARCALLGGETAELPGHYPDGEYDLAGFIVGVVDKDDLIDGRRVEVGDAVLGLASSGLHSNGYSLARRVLLERAGLALDAVLPELGVPLADELLRPTHIYVRGVLEVMQNYEVKHILRALAHVTGGGLAENVPRVLPPGMDVRLRRGSWPVPPIFGLIQRLGPVDDAEMFRVFNMGIGMVAIVPPYYAASVIRQFERQDYAAYVIGEVAPGAGRVLIEGP